MTELAIFVGSCFGVLLVSSALFHILARIGPAGRKLCDMATGAPWLDLIVFYFTTAPAIGAIVVWCERGERSLERLVLLLLVSILAQALTLISWSRLHEALHPGVRKGPRIHVTMSRRVGPVRNTLAVWWTALVVPLFNLVRVAEIALYPMLVYLVKFPKYPMRDWVNVSRHKFSGLVGYDLIWCLYCDWMTGIWSLGTEMLRNVESFWCPIRFTSPEKCENCQIDFPDLKGGWVASDQDMGAVTKVLEAKYPGPGGVNAWFGHPARLTVEGKAVE
jgi:hypothetical protein